MSKIINIEPLGFPWQTQDPFLFCAHHRDEYPAGNAQMGVEFEDLKGRSIGQDFTLKDGWRMYHGSTIPGFPYHPHRGFETITINKEGFVDHSDSLGAAGRFGAGDVQWMTAGKGVQHSEMFPLIHKDKGNPLEIFQVWLNLPKVSKMVDPHYKMLWKNDVPLIVEKDENGNSTEIDLIAGSLNGIHALDPTPDSWAADSNNYVGVMTIKMNAQAKWTLPAAAEGVNRSMFFYRGDTLKIEGEPIMEYHMAELSGSDSITFECGKSSAYLLILQGRPINEPVAQQGPFVMNTQDEIIQTIREYQRTQFGGWPWPEREPVHPRDKGRFALHADGTEEVID